VVVDRPKPRLGVAAAVVASACGLALVVAIVRGSPDLGGPSTGAVTTTERRTLAIGKRGVAVAEAGAALAWSVHGGRARVDQGSGDVFYRIDHGGPFVVATPLGEVRVTGTCFRIEVIMKPSKQSLIGGGIGAAVAAAVVVTVYEGGVVVADSSRGDKSVAAGERATLSADGTAVAGGATDDAIAAPDSSVTRDQLLARDELQRRRIAALSSRVGELERALADGGKVAIGGGEMGKDPWLDPSKEQLAEYAKQCKVRFDMPPVMESEPFQVTPEQAEEIGAQPGELASINQVLADLHAKWLERIRPIYVELTGNAQHADDLSADAMAREIEDKSPRGDAQAIRTRIAQERAGLVAPPADWSKASPLERYLRYLAGLGDETEQMLAAKIGPDRAHALRAAEDGWPMKMQMSGCDDDKREKAKTNAR
jgi:hypothetical protein